MKQQQSKTGLYIILGAVVLATIAILVYFFILKKDSVPAGEPAIVSEPVQSGTPPSIGPVAPSRGPVAPSVGPVPFGGPVAPSVGPPTTPIPSGTSSGGPVTAPVPSGTSSGGPATAPVPSGTSRIPPPSIGPAYFNGLCIINKTINIGIETDRTDGTTHKLTTSKTFIDLIGIPFRFLSKGSLIQIDGVNIFYVILKGTYSIYGYFIDQSGNPLTTNPYPNATSVTSIECGTRLASPPPSTSTSITDISIIERISTSTSPYVRIRCNITSTISTSGTCRVKFTKDATGSVLSTVNVPISDLTSTNGVEFTSVPFEIEGLYTAEIVVNGITKIVAFFINFGKPSVSASLIMSCNTYPFSDGVVNTSADIMFNREFGTEQFNIQVYPADSLSGSHTIGPISISELKINGIDLNTIPPGSYRLQLVPVNTSRNVTVTSNDFTVPPAPGPDLSAPGPA